MTPSQQRCLVETLRTKYSVRQISEVLDFNRNLFYYQPKSDPSEAELRAEIETLALRYPTYGYRRITQLLVNQGYPVGYRRVARLMKAANLSVSVKRLCQTTRSLAGETPWVNRVQHLEVCQADQVWVADITYIQLKQRFIYLALVMDVFTELVHTPVHGSWLNIAEIELSVFSRQCLRCRIPDLEMLRSEAEAWQEHRNKRVGPVDWRFTTQDARIKLKRLYPKTQS